jgi:IstB-like ATP binding protein
VRLRENAYTSQKLGLNFWLTLTLRLMGGNHALHYESICLGLPVGTPARVCLENPVTEGPCQASAEHFQQCAEFLPLRNRGLGQLVNARYERAAMILTSNRGFAEWGEVFGDPVVATALLDREAVSDPMRELVEDLWPELVHKLPPKE